MTRPRRQRHHAARPVAARVSVEELEKRLVTGGVVNLPALAFDADLAFAERSLLPGGNNIEAGALRRERLHTPPPPSLKSM